MIKSIYLEDECIGNGCRMWVKTRRDVIRIDPIAARIIQNHILLHRSEKSVTDRFKIIHCLFPIPGGLSCSAGCSRLCWSRAFPDTPTQPYWRMTPMRRFCRIISGIRTTEYPESLMHWHASVGSVPGRNWCGNVTRKKYPEQTSIPF